MLRALAFTAFVSTAMLLTNPTFASECGTSLVEGDLHDIDRDDVIFSWDAGGKTPTRPNNSPATNAQIEADDIFIRRELRAEPRELTEILFKLVTLKAKGLLANTVLYKGQRYRIEQYDRHETYEFKHDAFRIDLGGMKLTNSRSRRELIVNYRQGFAASTFGDFGLERTVFRIDPRRLRDLQL